MTLALAKGKSNNEGEECPTLCKEQNRKGVGHPGGLRRTKEGRSHPPATGVPPAGKYFLHFLTNSLYLQIYFPYIHKCSDVVWR
jgi:hypothetical protein